MGIEPRDQKFGLGLNKSDDVSSSEEFESLGKVSFDIYPLSIVWWELTLVSKCLKLIWNVKMKVFCVTDSIVTTNTM